MAGGDPPWTADQSARLAMLWDDERLSLQNIGHAIGRSRAAVAGKAHRLNLPPRPSPIPNHTPAARLPVARRLPASAATLPALVNARAVTPGVASAARPDSADELPGRAPDTPGAGLRTCQWVTHERPWRFCGRPVRHLGTAWCAEHFATVYVSHRTQHEDPLPRRREAVPA